MFRGFLAPSGAPAALMIAGVFYYVFFVKLIAQLVVGGGAVETFAAALFDAVDVVCLLGIGFWFWFLWSWGVFLLSFWWWL